MRLSICSLPVLVVLSLAGCEVERSGSPAAPLALGRSAAAVPVPVPGRSDVEALGDQVSSSLLERFRVSPQLAEDYARSYAVRKGYLTGRPTVCLALPRSDRQGNAVARQLLLSQQPCDTFAAILALGRSYWDIPAVDPPPTAALAAAIGRSSQRFFTVEVSAYGFHHPLHEAQRGMPSWLLLASRDGLIHPGRCSPEGLLVAEPTRGHFELVRYRCGGDSVVISHHQRRPVDPSELTAVVNVGDAYRRWRQVMKSRYSDRLDARLLELRELWSR